MAFQKLLDECFEYNVTKDLIYNPMKSVCITFTSCCVKLYCPTFAIEAVSLKCALN